MRVIQDSEDEDDLEIEGPLADREEPDAAPIHGSNSDVSTPGAKCTGSTESLRRAIVTAHRAQFRDGASSSERQHLSSSSELLTTVSPSAGNAALHGPEPSTSLPGHANEPRRTSLVGAVSTRDMLPTTPGNRHSGQVDDSINDPPGHAPDELWNLQGTMREDWEHHEPMGLFPHSASSTIPNATATQQQLLAEVLAPTFLGIEPEQEHCDVPKYEPARSSVPWSDYLKSSSEVQTLPQPAEHPLPIPSNTCASLDPSIVTRSSTHITLEPPIEGVNSPLRPAVEPLSDNEEISSQQKLQSSPDPIVSPLRETKHKPDSTPTSEDNLSALGLPEEYKPRPSRSRSLKISGEVPIDYSTRPGASVKKARRTRTSGDVETTSTATTPEKVRQICDMGFTPSTTKKALRQHNGDVTHTVNWLIASGGASEDELAPSRSSRPATRRKSNRDSSVQTRSAEIAQDKIAGSPVDENIVPADMDPEIPVDGVTKSASTSVVTKSPTVVKVVIPRIKTPATPPQNDEPQVTAITPVQSVDDSRETLGQPDAQPEAQPDKSSQLPKGKKRGRGRPKKETKTIEPIEEEPIVPVQDEPPRDTNNAEKPCEAGAEQANQTVDIESRQDIALTTPEPPPAKKLKQENDAPSSINKGKTPYRVGLSKRARIAPLLRVVKK